MAFHLGPSKITEKGRRNFQKEKRGKARTARPPSVTSYGGGSAIAGEGRLLLAAAVVVGRAGAPSHDAHRALFGREPTREEGGGGGIGVDRLVEAVRVVGREVDPAVAGADILELAMAKGPMFSWLSYWPEEGYSKEDHPY
uniref:Uncharacterized protein n=1 Tax=Leersia perrieri TaxID=77586 RepID=A0A0D9XKD2_9ORYZ